MRLERLGERGFIDWIRRRYADRVPAAPAGIGDDAALLGRCRVSRLVTTDCLIEGRHFRRDEPAFFLGRKSVAVNLSDIAAMGGRPESFVLTLCIPSDLPTRSLELLLDGIASSAREHDVRLVGGDTSGSPGPLVISITMIGRAGAGPRDATLRRDGARRGDGIYLSGPLGGSAAGRRLLESGWRPRLSRGGRLIVGAAPPRRATKAVVTSRRLATRAVEALRTHLDPRPRISFGRLLVEQRIATAAIDVSDGLSIDLSRLTEASDVGARLLAPALPIADSARALAPMFATDPLDLALNGGEDYELLFTVPPTRQEWATRLGALLIGRITARSAGSRLVRPSGRDAPLPAGGFDHFARPAARRALTSRK